ncbi:unnamed protein product [Schistosoma mattheei]|uniref:Uncharacterized protein n=1 Tax=Schistosoma mattheei TaxID=31246 RepID=A0AA85BYV8_9TREM|nr:unnamed protein product [Schistosoma mattheei]
MHTSSLKEYCLLEALRLYIEKGAACVMCVTPRVFSRSVVNSRELLKHRVLKLVSRRSDPVETIVFTLTVVVQRFYGVQSFGFD